MIKHTYNPLFNALYEAYPKKCAKLAAYKAFVDKEVTAEDVAQWIPIIQKQAAMWEREKREKKYIPSLGPWINGYRMDDEVEAGPKDCACGAVWTEGCGFKYGNDGKYKCDKCRLKLRTG